MLQGYRTFGMSKVTILSGFFKALLHVFHQLKQDTSNTHTQTSTLTYKHAVHAWHTFQRFQCIWLWISFTLSLWLMLLHVRMTVAWVQLCVAFKGKSLSNGTAMAACPAPCSMARASVFPNWGSTSTTNDTTPLNERAHGKCASISPFPQTSLLALSLKSLCKF